MAKSKAKKGKKNAASKKATEKAVEAKLAKKEELAVEAEEVEKLDEEIVDEEIKDEEIVEEDEVKEDDEEVVDKDDDDDEDDESDDSDDSDDDDEDDSDDDESEDDEDDSDDDDDSDDEDDEDDDEDEEPEVEVKKSKKSEKKADKKSEKSKKDDKKADKKALKKAEKKADKKAEAKEETKVTIVTPAKPSKIKEFFSRKFDANENILTIFKDSKIFGAILGEIFGTAVVTMVALTLGLLNPLYMIFAYLGITIAVVKLSGANLNPIVTAGMLATRRMSAIRGVLYLIAQVLGAWLGFVVVNGFLQAGIATGNIDAASTLLPTLVAADEITVAVTESSYFWPITMIEFLGAIIIGFAFARALTYKRSAFTFAITVAAGVFTAFLFAVVISSTYLGINDNSFILNPASAVVYGLFPSSAEGFDALMSALMPMLVSYVVFPVIGGIVGFYASDVAGFMSGEKLVEE